MRVRTITSSSRFHFRASRAGTIDTAFLGLHKSGNTLACSDLVIDLGAIHRRESEVALKLTRTEFSLLKYFMLHPNEVLSHTKILKEVWESVINEMQYLTLTSTH